MFQQRLVAAPRSSKVSEVTVLYAVPKDAVESHVPKTIAGPTGGIPVSIPVLCGSRIPSR
jgi:hypothetical protein